MDGLMSDKLISALRQYRHNNDDNFVACYDRAEADKIFMDIIDENTDLKMQIIDMRASLRTCFNASQGALDQYDERKL